MIRFLRMLAFLPGLLAFGCSCTERILPLSRHGDSYHAWFSAQVMNPGAPHDPSPAATLSGTVAMGIHEKRYVPAMTEKEDEDGGGKMKSQFGD